MVQVKVSGQKKKRGCWGLIKLAILGYLALAVLIGLLMGLNVIDTPKESTQTAQAVQQVANITSTHKAERTGTRVAIARATGAYNTEVASTEAAIELATEQQQWADATATATLWTPTMTFTPSKTPTETQTPTSTFTLSPTATDTPELKTYYAISSANARACPELDCEIVARLSWGQELQYVGVAFGDEYAGSSIWRKLLIDGQTAFVHSSLVSETQPQAQVVATSPPNTGGQTQPTQPPAPAQATSAPVVQPTQPPAPAFTCDCSKTCGAMASCEEAYYQLNTCGCTRRDSDGDSVPCESICPGG